MVKKNRPIFCAQRGGKIAISARHSVSTKPPKNKHETARRVIWTHPGDQIPLLWSQNVTKSPSYSIYIYTHIYIYFHYFLGGWVHFLQSLLSKIGPLVAFENGARSVQGENALILQCFRVLRGNELLQQVLEISSVVFGTHFRHSLRGSLLKGGYNNSLHVPLAVPTPAPTPPP